MAALAELIFEDMTDEFGKPYVFNVLHYIFDLAQDVNHRADEPVINHPDAHRCILMATVQFPDNYALQEWMMSYLSESATRKSGKLTSYSEDGSIYTEAIFESAECMQMDQKGELEPGRRELTKTITIRFSARTLAIAGVTIFGQLREDRRAGVPVTVRETEEADTGESTYTLESTYVHDHFMTIAKAIAKEFEEDNENALYQVYRSMATGAISNPPIEVRTDADTFVKYDRNQEKIIVSESDLVDIQQDNTKKLKLLNALTEAYGKHLQRQFPNEKSAIPSNSLLKFDGIANKILNFGTLTSPDYTGALTVDVNASSTDWACLVLDFGYTTKGVQANAYIGTSTAKAQEVIPLIHDNLGYFGYATESTTSTPTKDLDPIVAQWLEKETKVDPVHEGNIKSGIRYKVDAVEFMLLMQLRTYTLNSFGNAKVLELLNDLETSKHSVIILQSKESDNLSGYTVSRSVNIYEKELFSLELGIEEPDFPYPENKEKLKEYNEKRKRYEEETKRIEELRKTSKPNFDRKEGLGDSSIIRLKGDEGTTPSKETVENIKKHNIKRTELTVLLHEYYHAWRMSKGLVKETEIEEIKATQFVNENLRSKHNRRPFYDTLEVPLEEKYKN